MHSQILLTYGGSGGGSTDPYYADTIVIQHMDVNGGGTIVDYSPHAAESGCGIDAGWSQTTTNPKWGAAGMETNHTSTITGWKAAAVRNYQRLGGSDFAIECWIWFVSTAGDPIIQARWFNPGQLEHRFRFTGNTLYFDYTTNGSTVTTLSVAWTPSTGQWYHLAVSRDTSDLKFWVDGAQQGATQTIGGTIYGGNNYMYFGGDGQTSTTFNGYIDDFRITVGVPRYTTAFSVPTAAFPNS